jgi:hypothetical protein
MRKENKKKKLKHKRTKILHDSYLRGKSIISGRKKKELITKEGKKIRSS